MLKLMAATLVFLPLAAGAAQPREQSPPQPALQPQSQLPKPACDRFGRVEQAQDRTVLREPGVTARRLDQLPQADLHLTVDRTMDGCHIPVIVRQNYGATILPLPRP